jgi:hypothetical protein
MSTEKAVASAAALAEVDKVVVVHWFRSIHN